MIRFLCGTILICKQDSHYHATGDQGQGIHSDTDLPEFASELSRLVYSGLSRHNESFGINVNFSSTAYGSSEWLQLLVGKEEKGKISICEIQRTLDEEEAKIFLENFSKKFRQTVCFDFKPWVISS